MNSKSDLPHARRDLLILKIVVPGPVHGYAITQRIQQVSHGVVQVPEDSLYPALDRLKNRGFPAADWRQIETRCGAKFYNLTRNSRAVLHAESAWQRLAQAVA